MQLELIRFRYKYRIYSAFLCRTDGVNVIRSRVFAWIVVTACSIVITLSVTHRHCSARTETPSHKCMFDKRQFDYNRLHFWLPRASRDGEKTNV